MKKLLCVLMALMLLALPALAESVEVQEGDITVAPKSDIGVKAELRDISAFSAESGDAVTITGNNYTVDTGLVTLSLDLDPSLGYLCCTQDFIASLDSYFMFNDPEGIWNIVMENDMHYLFLNLYTYTLAYVWTYEPDSFSSQVGTLSAQSDMMQEAYLTVFARELGCTPNGLVTIGDNVWMRLDDVYYFTFVDGQIIQLLWEGDNAMTDADAQDVEDLLAGLSIYAD